MSIGNDILGGNYTLEQIDKITSMNMRERGTQKPNEAFYRKSMMELGPSWADKRELVRYLIHDSNITPISKNYLKECEEWVPKY